MKIYNSGNYLTLSKGKRQATVTPWDDGDIEIEIDDDDNTVYIMLDLEHQIALRDYLSENIEKHKKEQNEN